MTSPRPGDVWLADIPFSDGQGYKIRPVLVMWVDGTDAIVVSVTSSSPRTPQDVALNDWKRAGLRRSSTVRLLRPATIAISLITHKTGRVSRKDAARLVDAWEQHVRLRL